MRQRIMDRLDALPGWVRALTIIGLAAALAIIVALVAVVSDVVAATITLAHAQGAEEVGENTGSLLGTWARSLYAGVTAIVALIFLINRKYSDMGVFLLAAVIVGAFVFVPGEVAATIKDIWQFISGRGN